MFDSPKGFYGCSFVGYQDTLFTHSGTQYFGHSYIEGAVGESHDNTYDTAVCMFSPRYCTISVDLSG